MDPAVLQAAFEAQVPAMRAHGRVPVVQLGAAEWASIAAGEVHRARVGDRVLGVGFLAAAVEAVWVGALDDVHHHLDPRLTERWLPGTTPVHKVLYQHIDLPEPVDDREWVIVIESNSPLYAATGGKVWERTWTLDPRGPTSLAEVPQGPRGGVWTPTNVGGWTLLPVKGGCVVVYQVEADVGGNIPEDLVMQFAWASLDSMIDELGEQALAAVQHYRGEHFGIARPDGSFIPTW